MKKLTLLLLFVLGCTPDTKEVFHSDPANFDGTFLADVHLVFQYDDLPIEESDHPDVETPVDQNGPAVAFFGYPAYADANGYYFGSVSYGSLWGNGVPPYWTQDIWGQGDANDTELNFMYTIYSVDGTVLDTYSYAYTFTNYRRLSF